MKKKIKSDVTASSGNVFADIGSQNPRESLAKAKLAIVLGSLIEQQGLTQIQAARILGIDQPKVSMILRGRLQDFSMERLLKFLVLLNQHVEIVIQSADTRRVVKYV